MYAARCKSYPIMANCRCDACGTVGQRPSMRCAPDGWRYLEARDSEDADADTILVWACSPECAASMWSLGPGPRLDAPPGAKKVQPESSGIGVKSETMMQSFVNYKNGSRLESPLPLSELVKTLDMEGVLSVGCLTETPVPKEPAPTVAPAPPATTDPVTEEEEQRIVSFLDGTPQTVDLNKVSTLPIPHVDLPKGTLLVYTLAPYDIVSVVRFGHERRPLRDAEKLALEKKGRTERPRRKSFECLFVGRVDPTSGRVIRPVIHEGAKSCTLPGVMSTSESRKGELTRLSVRRFFEEQTAKSLWRVLPQVAPEDDYSALLSESPGSMAELNAWIKKQDVNDPFWTEEETSKLVEMCTPSIITVSNGDRFLQLRSFDSLLGGMYDATYDFIYARPTHAMWVRSNAMPWSPTPRFAKYFKLENDGLRHPVYFTLKEKAGSASVAVRDRLFIVEQGVRLGVQQDIQWYREEERKHREEESRRRRHLNGNGAIHSHA